VSSRNSLRRSAHIDHDFADGQNVGRCHSVEHTRQFF
jgi:hypothetical protein